MIMKEREILEGVVDLHLHAGPSVANRELDAGDMMKEAAQYGIKGFIIKDHYFPTMMSAALVNKHLKQDGVQAFGGLALNNSCGGVNLKAVATAHEMGAKIVHMPTVSAKNHIDKHKGKPSFGGSGHSTVEEKPIVLVDENGNLLPEVVSVLEYIAKYPEDLILSTGHVSLREVDTVVNYATEMGIKKILVVHPYFLIDASIDDMTRWAKLGAYIEINTCLFLPSSNYYETPLSVAEKILENVPIDKLVLDSDLGQAGNGSPTEGLYKMIMLLMKELNMSEQQINLIAKETPSKLVGINK